ncbi:uncharacterized protein [Eurosta solidaginis]|uniref:uncharacterized protein isoform X1 n=1 Tax=Eurosta solidaginis TaxID=178769 RepID=UPI0035306B2B
MAFSTQKEFFHVPFMNETVDYECRRACVKLKSYQSTDDGRSWAMDETLQSRFLSDLITCQTPVGGFGDGYGDDDDNSYDGFDSDGAGTSAGAQSGRQGPGQRAGGRSKHQPGRGGGQGGGGYGGGGSGGRKGPHYNTMSDASGYAAGAATGDDLMGAPSGGNMRDGAVPGSGGHDGVGAGGGTGREGRGGGGPDGGGLGGSSPGGGGGGPGGSRGGGLGGGAGGGAIGGAAARPGQGGLIAADSVIACATEQLSRVEELLFHKKDLEKKLEVSNERLKVVNMENDKIKAIMKEKFDSNHAKDFYNKIQKLTSSGKINKGEENELLHIYNKFEDMNTAYEILQAENAYLKRLMEKLSLRASYEVIKKEPEKSTDISFLQKEVNKLRQEVSMLRKFEDEKLKASMDSNRNKMSDQDADTLKAIIKERNALREKCKTFKELEGKVQQLQKIAKEADKMSDSLSNDLDNQSKHIVEMENEMREMQDYYENQISKMKFDEEMLKCQLDEMKEDLIRAKCLAHKTECLQIENSTLRNELIRRDLMLNEYDSQYKQLMNVIDELQGNAIQNLHDTQTQTCTDYMDDLTFFARATLSEIRKEIKKRRADGDKIGGGYFGGPAITDGLSPDECCAELRRMQDIVRKLTQENEYLQNNVKNAAEELCVDTLKKLKELEERCKTANDEITTLKKDKDDLNMNAMQKLNEFTDRVDKLGADVIKTAKDTTGMERDLKESIKLVQDISDIQLKNAQLTNAVIAISTRDDQRTLDDLRRQLLEEQAKQKQCQEENKNLREALFKRGIDPAKAVQEIIKEIPASVQDGPTGGPGAAKAGAGPEVVQKGGQSAAETGALDAVKKEGAGAAEVGAPDAVKQGGIAAAETGGNVAVKKDGPGAGERSAADAGAPDAAKNGEAGPTRAGGLDAAKKGEAGARGPDAAKKDGTGPGAAGASEAGRPDAAKKDGTGPGAAGANEADRQDATKKDGTGPGAAGASEAGRPDAAKKDGTGPGAAGAREAGPPDAAKTYEPGGGEASTSDGAKKAAGGPGTRGLPDAAKKGGPDAAKKYVTDAAKKEGPVTGQTGGPGDAKEDGPGPFTGETGGPGDAKKDGPAPVTGQTGGPGDAKKDGPGADKGGPDAGQVREPDAIKKNVPDAAIKDIPEAARKDVPAAAKKELPDAAKRDGPVADQAGVQDAAKKDKPGAGQAGGPEATKKAEPGAGPTTATNIGKKYEPAGGEVREPGAAKEDAPTIGEARGPDAAKKPGPTVGLGDNAAPAGGGATAMDTGGPGAAAPGTSGPEYGGPSPGGPVKEGPPVAGPGARGPGVRAPYGARPDDFGADGTAPDDAGADGRTGDGFSTGGGGAGDRTALGQGVGGGRAGPGVAGGPGPAKGGGPTSAVGKMRRPKGPDGPADDAFQQFVDSNANAMLTNIKAGSALEKELRAILNAFVMECGFCFCKSLIPKSKFYALCHKLLHNGIQCMAFRELAYMHRKIFMAADKLHPGCLLNMILTEQGFKDGETFKCCYCKNALCCSNSEEMLKEKVYKLERDIEMAKDYLDSLKAQPKTPKSPYTARGKTYRQMEDIYSEAADELLTCREVKPALSKSHSKQMKTLKARIMKCSELLR